MRPMPQAMRVEGGDIYQERLDRNMEMLDKISESQGMTAQEQIKVIIE